MKKIIIISSLVLFGILTISQTTKKPTKKNSTDNNYPESLARFNDYTELVKKVELHRSQRLLSLNEFLKMSKDEEVIVLDSRSEFRYKRKHLKGAINLNFSDFTQQTLKDVIPNSNTKILIYCNNNFEGDQIDFASKMMLPNITELPPESSTTTIEETKEIETQITSNQKPILLALNIPTYINLYGYGYKNVYELNELVNVYDARITFEGTEM